MTNRAIPTELLWGKADPTVSPGPHPAELHMLDVAAVAVELLAEGLPRALSADLLELAPEVLLTAAEVGLVVACHDLGKVTPGFAAKVPELRALIENAGASFPETAVTDHARSTAAVGPALLMKHGADQEAATLAIAAVAGHHGGFHPTNLRHTDAWYGGSEWQRAREEVLARMISSLGADPARFARTPSERWLMAIAGLTVVADWIGSDTGYFPYHPGEKASAQYFASARDRARGAIQALGWRTIATRGSLPSFSNLFPGRSPRPMQQSVIEAVETLDCPGLVLVEAPTGGGKTEAALFAAEYMMARFGLGGIYFGLPTQATSNQMLQRVRSYLEQSRGDEPINLHLLHSNSALNDDYRALKTRAVNGSGRNDASVVADLWFQGRKRGLLSPFAVGTIDQAMLAALRSRHFFLRMLGLARKVLIIDEVHAYDAFMSPILDRLLLWLKTLGSGVVLLSATLPARRREELVRCWHGSDTRFADGVQTPEFPRCIAVGSRETSIAIPRTADSSRITHLRWIRCGAIGTAKQVMAALRGGGCAAWIHNTVGDAQVAYEHLRDLGWPAGELVLFHARFPSEDRLERERRVLSLLSKPADRPKRLIVVATQVVEQSLDLDFDLMVSELAPVDLLVQRAGRLHRHEHRDAHRPRLHREPTLWLHVGGDEENPAFGSSTSVYDEHILLRTWWALRERQYWRVPEEADELMEAVYPVRGLDSLPTDLPPSLRERWARTAEQLSHALQVAASKGTTQLVPKPGSPELEQSFLDENRDALDDPDEAPHKHPDVIAKTRDIEATVTIACLAEGPVLSSADSTPVPLDDEVPHWLVRRLLNRTVTVQHRSVIHALSGQQVPAGWRRTALLRYTHPVAFDTAGNARLGGVSLKLDAELGLRISRQDEA